MNRKFYIAIVVLFSVQAIGFSQSWFKSKSPADQLDNAVKYYNERRYAAVESAIRKLNKSAEGEYLIAAQLLLMKTYYHSGKINQAKEAGRKFVENYPDHIYLSEVYSTFGDLFIDEGIFTSAFRMYFKGRQLAQDEEFIQKIDTRLVKTLVLDVSLDALHELLILESDKTNRSILNLALAYSELTSGQPDNCAFALNQIDLDLIPDDYIDLYNQLLSASYRPSQELVTIGVIMPLSGDNQRAGKAFINGLNQFISDAGAENNISFIIKDNFGSEIETINAVRSLISNRNVIAIIGPIDPHNALVAANSVYGEEIPLIIPLSIQDQLFELSSNVFQLNSNLNMRGRLAARYASEELELEQIAVLAPSDNSGQNLVDAFITELDRLGKSVVALEWYTGLPEDLSRQFKSIRRTAWELMPKDSVDEDLLGMEIDSLDAMFDISFEDIFEIPDEEPEKLTRSDSTEVILNTIQGIYIPGYKEYLSYIGTQFPVYNLNATIIGNENWQDLDVINQDMIGPHIENMVLITNWFDPDEYIQQMPEMDLESRYHYIEGADCANLLLGVIRNSDQTRRSLRTGLANTSSFQGLAHYYSFENVDNNLNTALQVLEYYDYQFHRKGFFANDSLVNLMVDRP